MATIAIDGPNGAGKSTIAKNVAKKLNCIYVDTGAMYRAVGLYFLENKLDVKNAKSYLNNINVQLRFEEGIQKIILNNVDVSERIRMQDVAEYASKVATIKEVRVFLVEKQQEISKNNSVVMDGRDIGTRVLPFATLKIYLDADENIRAKRRYDELIQKGVETTFDTVLEEIQIRDKRDKYNTHQMLRRLLINETTRLQREN